MRVQTEVTATPVAVVKAPRARPPKRHRLEEHPPPPMRACTIDQIEVEHPGVTGRLRQWIHRADASDPDFAWLKFCIIRVGRAVLIDEVRFRDGLYQRTAIAAAPSRTGKDPEARKRVYEKARATKQANKLKQEPAA